MRTLYVAGLLTLAAALPLHADNKEPSVLDNALNDGTSPAAADTTKPVKPETTPKPAPAAAKPPVPEVIDPNAARTVDSEDLVKKLTGETPTEAGPEQMLDEVVQRMTDSATRLNQGDPGPVTVETQRRIIVNLDALIELAKKKQSGGGSASGSGKKPGQSRQQNPGSGSGKGPHNPGGSSPAQESQLPGGGIDAAQSNGQDIAEKGHEWGNLPDRDRDLVANGSKETPLPAYLTAVQRYYRALADLNRASRDNR